MQVLRTPEECFEEVQLPFESHYAEVDDGEGGSLRVHYLDEGPAHAAPVLLLHGEPTWCYLYRKMIPVLVDAGHRVIAPDLVGFGRSDKPADTSDYTYRRMVDWMVQLLHGRLDLSAITYFGQDWGALVGLRLVALDPDRYARVVIGNGGLPTGFNRPNEAFLSWQKYSKESPRFDIGRIVAGGCLEGLTDADRAAYDAPFPDDTYKAGPRILPSLVPTSVDDPAHEDNVAAWEVLKQFERPFLCTFSDGDKVTAGGERAFIREVPGAAGQDHVTIEGGGHFLQEDRGEPLARVIAEFIERT